jgi:uncharacterized protein (TIGR00661 family)
MKILYAINSDGLGHAVRSIPIINQLKKEGYKIHLITSKNVIDFLGKKYSEYTLIPQNSFSYKNNEINYWNTFIDNFYISKGNLPNFKKIIKLIKNYKPDILISDLERYSLWCAQIMEIPTICIDNHSTIFRGEVEFNIKDVPNFLTTKSISKILAPHADRYFGLCFYKTKIIKKNTMFFDPILLDEQYSYKPNKKDFILVYNRFLDKKIISELKNIKTENFVLFGSKKDYVSKNIKFIKMGTSGMYKYIADAKAFITNGGHTAISEAIYYKTPIYSIPIKKQFEQITNANYLEKMGFGEKHKNINKNKLESFLKKLDYYKKNLNKHKYKSKSYFYKELKKAIKELIENKENKKRLELKKIKKIFKK